MKEPLTQDVSNRENYPGAIIRQLCTFYSKFFDKSKPVVKEKYI
jgi:hypothetical protein